MGAATGKTRTVLVTWNVLPECPPAKSRVTLIDGYTTEDDIPNILAVAYMAGVLDAKLIRVLKVEEID